MKVTTIRSVQSEHVYEAEKSKGSRFLAHVIPCENLGLAKNILGRIRSRYPDASHHCWAWQGSARDEFRYSDDGEPSGSGGAPIHNAIVGRELVGVLVVVVRYFGGTKLGTGGLVRAYGGCAAEALDKSDIVEIVVKSTLRFCCHYADVGLVKSIVNSIEYGSVDAQYAEMVRLTVQVPIAHEEKTLQSIQERSAGRVIRLED